MQFQNCQIAKPEKKEKNLLSTRSNIVGSLSRPSIWIFMRLYKISVIFKPQSGDYSESCKLLTLNTEILPCDKYRSY